MVQRAVLFGIVLCAFMMLSESTAHAINVAGLSAYPTGKSTSDRPYFTYILQAGQQVQDSLTVTNTGNTDEHFKLYAVDALLTNNNGFGLLPAASPKLDVSNWIQLPADKLDLAAGASRQIVFTIQVPSPVSVGNHYGGIIVEPSQPTTTTLSGQSSVTIIRRIGVRLYATIDGQARSQLTLSRPRIKRNDTTATITVQLQNNGNTLLSPLGSLVVKNSLGNIIAHQPIQANGIFSPGRSMTIQTKVAINPNLLQRYSVTAEVTYGQNQVARTRQTFWVFGRWMLLFGCLASIIVAVTVRRYLSRRK